MSMDFTQYLPEELSMNIFSRLAAPDICRLSSVNSTWRRMCNDPALWKTVSYRAFPRVIATTKEYQVRVAACDRIVVLIFVSE